MAYIGKEPTIGNYQKCDAISVVNGQAAYTLQVASTNVVPETNNHVLCSLNGILQSPGTSFTVSGSTLTFASNLATGDVIDFVMILGNVLDLGVPSDSTVSLAKLTATGTKDATTFLRGDNTFASAGGANTPSFMAVQTSATSLSAGAFTKVQFNSEIFDTDNTYDNSSNYRFTPATAGKYMIGASASCSSLDPDEFFKLSIYKNGSETITSNSINYKVTQQTRVANSLNPSLVVSFVDLADADDYYEVFAYNGDGGANNTDLNLGNFFYAYKIIE